MNARVPLEARLAAWLHDRLVWPVAAWLAGQAMPAWEDEDEWVSPVWHDDDPGYDAGYQDGYEKAARKAADDGPQWPDGW